MTDGGRQRRRRVIPTEYCLCERGRPGTGRQSCGDGMRKRTKAFDPCMKSEIQKGSVMSHVISFFCRAQLEGLDESKYLGALSDTQGREGRTDAGRGRLWWSRAVPRSLNPYPSASVAILGTIG